MDETKYEKINGREAIRRLVAGEQIYKNEKVSYKLTVHQDYPSLMRFNGPHSINDHYSNCPATVDYICGQSWYIKKPFDVRKTMFDRPNEWVAAYNDDHGAWIQVGFDTVGMRPVKAYHGYTGDVEGGKSDSPTPFELEKCIPIEDVPENER